MRHPERTFTIAALVLLIISTWCSGCVSALNVAIASSNGLGDMLDATAPIVEERCTRPYRTIADHAAAMDDAKRLAAVSRLDELCLPLATAYDSARAAHIAAIAAIIAAQAAENGKAPDAATLLGIGVQAAKAGESLAESVRAMQERK